MRSWWRVLADHAKPVPLTCQIGSLRQRSLGVLTCVIAVFVFTHPIAAQGIRLPERGDDTAIMRATSLETNLPDKTDASLMSNERRISVDAGRAGISANPQRLNVVLVVTTGRVTKHGGRMTHTIVGAGVGAVVGIVVGAIIGAHLDRTRPGTYSAVPITAVEGGALGLLAGLVIGASIP